MSTRCNIGIGPLEEFIGLYIHSDGYPDVKIAELTAWLQKNGYPQFVKVIKNTYAIGGKSFDGSLNPNSIIDTLYNKGNKDGHVKGKSDALNQEFAYIVNKDIIDVYNWGKKLGTINWKKGANRETIEYIFDPGRRDYELNDGAYYAIGNAVYMKFWEKLRDR